MSNPFFDHPILNTPYDYPARHWDLDDAGQPTQNIIERRRSAKFITPIPKPKKRKKSSKQTEIVFDEGKGLSSEAQQYDPTSVINEVRQAVDAWRELPNPDQWQVTPETARLLRHWRHHNFSGIRPFFCQVEAAETAIWLAAQASSWRCSRSRRIRYSTPINGSPRGPGRSRNGVSASSVRMTTPFRHRTGPLAPLMEHRGNRHRCRTAPEQGRSGHADRSSTAPARRSDGP